MAGALKYAIMQTFMVPTQEIIDGDATTPEVPSGSQQARAQQQEQRELPPREQIMSKLDEACTVLGKTRAALTEKWRKTNEIGPATNLDDPEKVSDLVLYRYVLTLQPWIEQARANAVDSPEPTAEERAAAQDVSAAAVLCDALDESVKHADGSPRKCTKVAGHDGDHAWW
jgi:hypothetical protein